MSDPTQVPNLSRDLAELYERLAVQERATAASGGSGGSVDAGDLTGATLAAGVTASSLTSVGTLTSLNVTGDVGIGTTSPGKKLDVADSGTAEVRIRSTDSVGDSALLFGNADDSIQASVKYDASAQALELRGYNNNTRMTIDSGGNVGIGTTSPSKMLHVGDSSTAGSFRVHASGGHESFLVNGAVVRSTNIRDLTTANAANIYVATSNGTMYRSTSSSRYKTDVEDLWESSGDSVLEMRPVWYRSLCENDPDGYSYYGLIAEELAEIDPRFVFYGPTPGCACLSDDDGEQHVCESVPSGVQYERLVVPLIATAQKQAAQIGQLEAANLALSERLDTLESR